MFQVNTEKILVSRPQMMIFKMSPVSNVPTKTFKNHAMMIHAYNNDPSIDPSKLVSVSLQNVPYIQSIKG